ncbi:hypothetical protein LOZ39_002560 [Ophidiomyces ophidiicola]|nr:hypothetical protein LOZ64_001901 [Ophidiomyces ophidiicola]KAI2006217.1 hypothetical protein LOZ49_005112 [Ophidiomyces ophidiicola]KAI2017707.1 hypothetical protein LOZ46_004294 [Ophidiomyces ophidiicola]KAI2076806.1 hypothetical protein LOZ39_002560 [Ophidiomyces ophidiicola]KAI2131786.1 hypothetical protein LOZ28_006083 [Ophidiomyces ophidiicola]
MYPAEREPGRQADNEPGAKRNTGLNVRRNSQREPSYTVPSHAPRKRRFSVEEDAFTIEDISALDAGYDADVEVLWPYQYEEADTSISPSKVRSTGPRRLEHDDISHSALIDWMGSLHCDSDKDSGPLKCTPKETKKRKSRPSLDSLHRRYSSRFGRQDGDSLERGRPVLPKRTRRSTVENNRCVTFTREADILDGLATGLSSKRSDSAPATNDGMDLD